MPENQACLVLSLMSSLFLNPLCTTQDFNEIQFPLQHIELRQIPSSPLKKYAFISYPPLNFSNKTKIEKPHQNTLHKAGFCPHTVDMQRINCPSFSAKSEF